MATSNTYERGFDEDEQHEANQCPERGGRVATVFEDCRLVVNEDRIDHGPEWRPCNADKNELAGN